MALWEFAVDNLPGFMKCPLLLPLMPLSVFHLHLLRLIGEQHP